MILTVTFPLIVPAFICSNSPPGFVSDVIASPAPTLTVPLNDTEIDTVQPNDAGVASVFPAGSVALTAKVCGPLARAAVANGDAQAEKAPPSTEHSNVDDSLAENIKSPVVSLLGSGGIESIDVWGAAVSTVHAKVAGVGSVFKAASMAATLKVCGPSARTAVANGDAHDAKHRHRPNTETSTARLR